MNLHITPSFKIDRLCKTASVLLFLVLKQWTTLQTLFCSKNYFLGPIWPKRIHLSNVALCLRFVWIIMKVLQKRFNFNCIEAWLLSNNLVSSIVDALA